MTRREPFAEYVAGLEPGDDLKVFPVVPGDKRPACAGGFRAASADRVQLGAWATATPDANIGHSPEDSGHFVLDVDPKNGGEESLAALVAEHGPLPPTFTVRTPSGGSHFWFRGSAPTSAGRLAPGLDIRGRGGYVLLEGSCTAAGDYIAVGDASATEPPAWLLEKISAPTHTPQGAPDSIDLDSEVNLQRAESYLRAAAPAIAGQGGDHHTYVTACKVLNLGLTGETALRLLLEHWNPRCNPPWDDDELRTKVFNAGRYSQNAAGAWGVASPLEVFGQALDKHGLLTSAEGRLPVGPVSFANVLARRVGPVPELVDGLIERGTVTFLSAPGGSHKSRLAVQWGLCIDRGAPIFGRAVEQSTFVYLSYEDHPDEVARRSQAITRRLSLPADVGGQYWNLSGRDCPLAVVHEKRNHGPKGKPTTLHWSEGVLLPRSEATGLEQEAQLIAAVVRVAGMAATAGAPLTMQKLLLKWQLDEIEREVGRRPMQREVKDILAAALPCGRLRYIRGSKNQAAGYYPGDLDQAAELAREAKHRRSAGQADG